MTTYIVLLRGINVGGNNKVAMKALKALLEENDFDKVSTYIQSGNLVLQYSENPSNRIQQLIAEHFGFTIDVMALNTEQFNAIVEANPYPNEDPKCVHFYICNKPPELNQDKLQQYIAETECYEVHHNVFYLHAPNGIGRSKLVANIETCLGTASTGRNLNTINKLSSMLCDFT